MKTYELSGKGLDHLKIVTREKPSPKKGEVLIRMRAASLNYRDLMIAKGVYRREVCYPLIPLSDGAGEIESVGEGVSGFIQGDRVMGSFFPFFFDGLVGPETDRRALGGDLDGVLSEYVILGSESVVKIPSGWSFEEASTLPCAALTAWNALYGGIPLLPGQTVLVLGTGGVSMYAALFARMGGARVMATSRSREKLLKMRAFGVEDLIDTSTSPDWDDQVHALTLGRGVDHVVDVLGGESFNRSLRAVRVGGQVSVIGVLSGTAGNVDTALILGKAIGVRGIYVGNRRQLEEMSRALEHGSHRPAIDGVFSFSEAREALMALDQGAHFGKIVIRV
ncbi:zinc-dependent alcohol dehydrogenase family protein [Leptospirillum ferrooxidans]|jgi:NADPH:quinone reductase-like Zn-dependent oxidoreductase|uniref:Putative alcohol dehydrogenase zincbinding domain protein n=1 Tax=Leptospirillum ferrooxidans (strain C2-3) TaxID=1162668 RepID=I0IKM4_LEPFC|nr:NAD(P)-dependent alcohol dehydrogenase [Leptospirillum ferrooxidans]BAM05823.1 putative alcohol dehydrogenase zincbinding domain protein [Leptospirillum ferrooxidans C2-3]